MAKSKPAEAMASTPAAPSSPLVAVKEPSKVDAVREALRERGMDASAADVKEWIAAKYPTMEFGASMLANYVSQQKKKMGAGGSGGGKPGRKKREAAPAAAPSAPTAAAPAGSISSDLGALQSLITRYGTDEVKRLTDMLGK